MSGAGKSVTVCDLLTQTEGYFGYTVIIEEGLSYGIYAAHSASQRLSGNQNMRQDPKAVVSPTRMLSFQRERLLLHFRDYRRRAPPVAIGAFAAQSQIAHPIEPAILDRAEQRRPVGAGLDWLAPVAGHGTGADHEVRRSQFAKHRGQRSCQATESRGQRDPAQPRGDQQLQNLPGQIAWLGQEGSRRLRLDAGPAFPQGRLRGA